MKTKDLDELCVNTIRMLSVDMVEKAKSGHPGMPLGAAPMAYVLWTKFLRHNPFNPKWPDRDRFILSAGHGSALLYSLLNLTGYDLSLDELKNFRQWNSKTPGHPEYHLTTGVEATTGPLGQGFAMGVGMAIAETIFAQSFNRKDAKIVDHYTYGIVSDGDLMEGISSEAASLAGNLKLGKLIYLYDDNHISIEGDTSKTFTEDVLKRFDSYGWHTQRVKDGNDLQAIEKAIAKAKKEDNKPSLIAVRTHIGYGSPKHDTGEVHGEPLGEAAFIATKEFYGWPKDNPFYVPKEAGDHFREAIEKGRDLEESWNQKLIKYHGDFPADAEKFMGWLKGKMPDGYDSRFPEFKAGESLATREASGKIMNAFAIEVENFVGGSADLAPSTKTILQGFGDVGSESDRPRNMHFGVREHAMGAIVNGMALHGGLIPFGATFLIFSDYMRPAIRLASIMNTHSIFVFTHDSIGLGEDGPTHQPVEQVMSLRAIPNLKVIRPADANETADAWRVAMESDGPVALILTRQKLPTLDAHKYPVKGGLKHGAYVLSEPQKTCNAVIIATGSEVHLALQVQEKLEKEEIHARVVSMPSWRLFEKESKKYQDEVLPPDVKTRISIEAGVTLGWERWVGDKGLMIGLDHFGASAPGQIVMKNFGFDADAIVEKIKKHFS